ncbi:sulfurtransferase TusA family protein [Sphingobium sufflavum]|uniref:sulfurtransferase TusA family protein n=1 Tax=Sphingobium sufflavum TaxID=1129547 RepID=UPI001F3A2ECE|nr:sulfurtransferase TusA family protein [Sphingobium sufflavum]MCE7797928.1 sulfurtransferase TusA family protein [Sphingobium sufflavum]
MAEQPAPLIVDARGMRCPWPVLRAARAMRGGAPVLLISDDPIARRDVPDMAHARGWQCTLSDDADATQFLLTPHGA